ncbi:peptide chain release factor N(5)-glutamine methyltransferase [Salipiger sp. IMCC34102]|uniref:peptide chain release factor N(5)-glutamine methyltransferase n=1 Tax=Salipiger sp. IMCC34102 TaxID=2510647 RepID=UPI00101DA0C6|nr:peptide chain release factor N(5)-glutamine methyltransferase [Salipiger sp. IMCC34102]RYH03218.1 peptide chain release factor N(5)-glutamine methyltransferase [Salipiger sp. IMCC34102]
MTWDQVLRQASASLSAAGLADAPRDARRLLAHVLECDPSRLSLLTHEAAPDDLRARFDALIAQRARRIPVSHLTGRRAFYGRDFAVSRDVLDPRPETETLIARALEHDWSRVLDLGTGSGCILLTLLAERAGARGLGTDLSAAALTVAARNADMLKLADRVAFQSGDWLDAVPAGSGPFDLIVSNPPYIARDEMPGLDPELDHEPRLALTDEADGLTAYRRIARDAPAHLAPNGVLLVEIGPTQGAAVADLFAAYGLSGIAVDVDLDGRDRVVSGHFGAN